MAFHGIDEQGGPADIGGAAGTNARYWLSRWFDEVTWARGFPLGTFVINVTGSFVLGLAAVVVLERMPPTYQNLYILIGTGFCGRLHDFLHLRVGNFKLVRDGSWRLATMNVVGSVVAGFLGVLIAVTLMGVLFPKR